MGTSNPFDDVLAVCQTILATAQAVLDKISEVRPEWESVAVAMATRRKGKKALMEAVKDGRVRSKRVESRGPSDAWLLNTRDLDEHFPVRKK